MQIDKTSIVQCIIAQRKAEGLFESNRRDHLTKLHDPVFRADIKTQLLQVAEYYLSKLKYIGEDKEFIRKEAVLIDAMIKISCEDIDLYELPLVCHEAHFQLIADVERLITRMKNTIDHVQSTLTKFKELSTTN